MSFDFNGDFLTKPVLDTPEPLTVERISELLVKMNNKMNSIDAMILQCDDKHEMVSLACSLMASARLILRNSLPKEQYDIVMSDLLKGII